jgi:hypothetical protein
MKARISQLHKTEAAWNQLEDFCPEAGEIIIYDQDENIDYVRIKVGDGNTPLKQLPFFIDVNIQDILQKNKFDTIVDGGRITGKED